MRACAVVTCSQCLCRACEDRRKSRPGGRDSCNRAVAVEANIGDGGHPCTLPVAARPSPIEIDAIVSAGQSISCSTTEASCGPSPRSNTCLSVHGVGNLSSQREIGLTAVPPSSLTYSKLPSLSESLMSYGPCLPSHARTSSHMSNTEGARCGPLPARRPYATCICFLPRPDPEQCLLCAGLENDNSAKPRHPTVPESELTSLAHATSSRYPLSARSSLSPYRSPRVLRRSDDDASGAHERPFTCRVSSNAGRYLASSEQACYVNPDGC